MLSDMLERTFIIVVAFLTGLGIFSSALMWWMEISIIDKVRQNYLGLLDKLENEYVFAEKDGVAYIIGNDTIIAVMEKSSSPLSFVDYYRIRHVFINNTDIREDLQKLEIYSQMLMKYDDIGIGYLYTMFALIVLLILASLLLFITDKQKKAIFRKVDE